MDTESSNTVDGLLRSSQIIIGALAAGVLMFLVIIVVGLGSRIEPFDTGAIVSMVMGAFALAAIPVRLLVPGSIVSSNCRKIARGTWAPSGRQPNMPLPDTDDGKLLQVFMVKTIVGGAILEGAAFANLIAFMLEGQVYSIVLAVLFLLGILMGFPTRTGLSEWLDTQLQRLREYRAMSDMAK